MAEPTSPVASSISDAISFLSERGVLSGLYLGTVFFAVVAGSTQVIAQPDGYLWIAVICLLLGLVASSVTYELFRIPIGWLTNPIVVRTFNKTVQDDSRARFTSYKQIRKFRESFLASDGSEHFKANIRKELRIGQMLAYLGCSSALALIVLYLASQELNVPEVMIDLELWFASFVLVAAILGGISRCISTGRTIGLAYVSMQGTAESEVESRVESKGDQHESGELK
jgi:hypothetical protein